VGAPSIPTVILGEAAVVQACPEWCPRHPEEHWRGGYACLNREVIARPSATPRAVGWPGEPGARKRAGPFVWAVQAALGCGSPL
jgi:hypothetical protein